MSICVIAKGVIEVPVLALVMTSAFHVHSSE